MDLIWSLACVDETYGSLALSAINSLVFLYSKVDFDMVGMESVD